MSSEQPYFSVIVPVFNRAKTILPTLASVRNQVFGDFECIIVDDGSVDGDALQSVVEDLGDDRFVYKRRENGGGGAARNTGLDAARGLFVAFLDSDDLYEPHKLSNDYHITAKILPTRTVLFRQVQVNRGVGKMWLKPSRGPRPGERISEYLACAGGFIQTSTLVMPAEVAKRIKFSEGLPFGQDTDFAIRVAADGQRFLMAEIPSVIWNDISDPNRVSASAKYLDMLEWVERNKPILGIKAFHAYRGWHIARLAAPTDIRLALRLYREALFSKSMAPKIAAVALIQILLPRSTYRMLANLVVRVSGSSVGHG